MKPKASAHPPSGLFSIAVSRPPLPTSDKALPAYRSQQEESPLKNSDMPYIVMVIQSVIIFITLSAFILYVFSPRSLPHLQPTSAPAFTVHFETRGEQPLVFPAQVQPDPTTTTTPYVPAPIPATEAESPASHHSHSMLAKFRKAAVVSDHGICSEIGRSILTRGGNAVDAAIATLFCIGVTNPQSSGIGGGFFMQVYNKTAGACKTINSRETAPKGIDIDVYKKNPQHTSYGWKSIAVPGEIAGFWRAFNDHGSKNVQWAELIQPTIRLCREGIPVSEYLASILKDKETADLVVKNNELRVMFTNPATNKFYEEGEIMKRPNLAKTLERLAAAADPVELFYKGDLAQTIVKEIQEGGGFLDLDDLEDYEPTVKDSVTSSVTDEITQCGPPPPSSWIVTQLIVKIMEELYPAPRRSEDLDSVLFYHRLIEAEKFAYSQRTKLGDPFYMQKEMDQKVRELTNPATAKAIAAKIRDDAPLPKGAYMLDGFIKEDSGTSHVSVIDEHGNAVSVTSTINLWLGSKVASSLGIIWNDQMDDFSVEGQINHFGFNASTPNLMQPGKTPMSSMSPTIVYNNGDHQVRVVIGTTGGSKIIQASGVASTIVRSLLFGQTIKEAIDAPQIWHQITPEHVQYEKDFPESIISALRDMGHKLRPEVNMHSTTHAIFVEEKDGYIYANSDKRSKVHMHPDGY